MSTTPHSRPVVLATLAALFWAGNFVAGRFLHGQLSPLTISFGRWLVALLCLAPVVLPRWRTTLPQLRPHWRAIVVLGLAGIALCNTLIYRGVTQTSATNAVMLSAFIPMGVLLGGHLFCGLRMTVAQTMGTALSFCGVAFILTRGQPAALLQLTLNPGDLWILAAVVCWAAYTLKLRHIPASVDKPALLFAVIAAGALCLAPAVALEWSLRGLPHITPQSGGVLLFLGVFPSVLSYQFYNVAVGGLGGARASSFMHLIPPFGTIMSLALLGEQLHWWHVAGLAVILAGVAVANGVFKGHGFAPTRPLHSR
ncbi:drug/metabolite transporter (DMT)-like permease [Silvimonas terrae]|uniref:Drug/metabolite transporter (DMT)-like permease n=1 Tax=Silvimonas terrae TaxID=300266 RepID=A0A840RE74_9NEIS|nr:DMT family transporter [Silvimonas terrae]MBB5191809.1 drug/metabolite transporter (DMT)-like permease [Silvimonas terrae]